QHDVAVGSAVANRNRAEIEGLVGFFVNTLVLRGDLSGDPEFRELTARVREAALGAYAHQDLPFEQLVEALEPERSLSHSPLVQVAFVLQNPPRAVPELAPGLRLELESVATGEAKFELTLGLLEDEEGLQGEVEYGTDLFDATTIRRLVGHYRNLLAAAAADPERRLSQLPLLSPAESHELLLAWNDTRSSYPRERSISELFELQAQRTPEAVAVVFGAAEQRLTYRELNRRANRFAHHLRSCGVGRDAGPPEVCVGLCVERSPEMVVAILGILKAGGAY
ncbi:MAG: AMP-binding protein, partial [bacterium]|nr:AMP-binding protein [bacterium]